MVQINVPKKALLIWTPFDMPNVNFLPLGYGYIASNISAGCDLEIVDYVLQGYSDQHLIDTVREKNPSIIGLSFWEINFNNVKHIADVLKRNYPDIPIVLGGPSASTRKNAGLDVINADYAIKGEGERSFDQLLQLVFSGETGNKASLDKIPGLVYRDNEAGGFKTVNIEYLDLSQIRYPDYEKIRLGDYLLKGYEYGYFPKKVTNAPIITTRGCPYPCEYCSARFIHGLKIRTRPVANILEEISILYDRYGVRGINIIDDNFTFHKEFVVEVCEKLIEYRKKHIFEGLFLCTPNGVRMQKLDEQILKLMKDAGWTSLVIAPESGSEKTLKSMKKKITLDEISYYAKMVKAAGLKLFAFFMIGYPGETVEDIRKTIRFACSLPFDQITFSPFNPLPGTPIYDRLLAEGEIDGSYSSGNYFKITYAPSGMSVNKLKAMLRLALVRSILFSWRRLMFLIRSYDLKRIYGYAKGYFGK